MKRAASFVFALMLVAAPATAQDDLLGSCATLQPVADPAVGTPPRITTQFRFLCGQVVNAMSNAQPSIGIAFSGGAHTLGTASTLGRRLGVLPRVSATLRLNAAFAEAPNLLDGYIPTFNAQDELPPMGTSGLPVASIQGDVAVGLFNGLSLGPAAGGLGAIDLLGSLSYVPGRDELGLEDDIINAGIGARVGILKQGLIMPGISVSAMYRTQLDDVTFGDMDAGDPATFSSDLSTLSLRAGISKGILMFDLAAGAGWDRYSSDVLFDFELQCPAAQCTQDVTLSPSVPIEGELTTAAWNVYGNVGISLLLVNVVGEIGYQKATDIVDLEALQNAGLPDQAPTEEDLQGGRFFGSIGVRLSL